MGLYEQIERELLDEKSLAALIWLIDRGRELEFSANGVACFISRSGSARYVSLWVDGMNRALGVLKHCSKTLRFSRNLCSISGR